MSTTVRISETYDLSTEVNKLSLVGIHTPSRAAVSVLYDGLLKNHKFARLAGCDVTVACASMLPADPQQIGVESGDIAPQDMFNPILYKAVSNETFNTIQNRIYSGTDVNQNMSVNKSEIDMTSMVGLDEWDVYYGLLADADGWRKAMPQQGLQMRGLYPIVFQVLQNYGQQTDTMGVNPMVPNLDGTGSISHTNSGQSIRGNPVRMPKIPLNGYTSIAGGRNPLPIWFPTTYVAAIVMPPAKLNVLYYRMKVTWTIELLEPIPSTYWAGLENAGWAGKYTYASDYAEQSKKMDELDETVDARGANVEHVMTSTK